MDVWFLRYVHVGGQTGKATDIHTCRHVDHNTSHSYECHGWTDDWTNYYDLSAFISQPTWA